jgi:HD superfamily phosphohydrolase
MGSNGAAVAAGQPAVSLPGCCPTISVNRPVQRVAMKVAVPNASLFNKRLITFDESCRFRTMQRNEIVKYWLESSDDDYQVMQSLFDNGHYAWALFLSHLVIEKLLKAYYKNRFQKKATRPFAEEKIAAAKELRQWLLKKIRS